MSKTLVILIEAESRNDKTDTMKGSIILNKKWSQSWHSAVSKALNNAKDKFKKEFNDEYYNPTITNIFII